MDRSRRDFLAATGAAVLFAMPVWAQSDAATQSVLRQLEGQGFRIISVTRTLLGRVRIISRRGDLEREIVLDPRNGVILRDYTVGAGGDPTIGSSPGQGGASSGADGREDDDDEEDGDEDGGDDEDGGGDSDDDGDDDDD